jgi:hypothetical protein
MAYPLAKVVVGRHKRGGCGTTVAINPTVTRGPQGKVKLIDPLWADYGKFRKSRIAQLGDD